MDTIVSFDDPPPVLSYYVAKNPSTLRTADTQRFLWSNSTSDLIHCNERRQCRRRACPWCAHWHVRALRKDLGKLANPSTTALFIVLSTESSRFLNDGYDALADTRKLFLKRSWLTTNSKSWIRTTEITHRSGLWNVHDNYVVFGSLDQLNTIRDQVAVRWASAAVKLKYAAAPQAQYAEFARNTEATLAYIAKGLMEPSSDTGKHGRTPADILADYKLGDADAADQWHEIENLLASGRAPRLVARGGALRSTGAAAIADA